MEEPTARGTLRVPAPRGIAILVSPSNVAVSESGVKPRRSITTRRTDCDADNALPSRSIMTKQVGSGRTALQQFAQRQQEDPSVSLNSTSRADRRRSRCSAGSNRIRGRRSRRRRCSRRHRQSTTRWLRRSERWPRPSGQRRKQKKTTNKAPREWRCAAARR